MNQSYDPTNAYNNVQSPAGEWVRPQYGVGFGGQGAWFNRHFATLAEAEIFYGERVASLPGCYRGRTQSLESIPAPLIKRFRIVNLKADGKPGKLVQTVQMYQIPAEAN